MFRLDEIKTQVGKVFLITGANSGLGYETSKFLLGKGATIIMCCRDLFKGEKAKQKLLKFNLGEVCTVDENLNQNAAARILKRQNLFDEFYSTKFGVVKCPVIDIHDKNDLKKVKKIMSERSYD